MLSEITEHSYSRGAAERMGIFGDRGKARDLKAQTRNVLFRSARSRKTSQKHDTFPGLRGLPPIKCVADWGFGGEAPDNKF